MRPNLVGQICAVLFLSSLSALATPIALEAHQSGISQAIYDDLVRYTKYSSAVYQWICPKPLGNVMIKQVRDGVVVSAHIRAHSKYLVRQIWHPRICSKGRFQEGDCRRLQRFT